MEKVKFSYLQIESYCKEIYKEILKQDYVPDYILGVSVGGLYPTILFSRLLDNQNVTTISLKSYSGTKRKNLKIINLPSKRILKNKKILVIDDILDSGETFKFIKNILKKEYSVKDVKFLSIFVNKKNCKFYPDFYFKEVDKWICFPWDKFEK